MMDERVERLVRRGMEMLHMDPSDQEWADRMRHAVVRHGFEPGDCEFCAARGCDQCGGAGRIFFGHPEATFASCEVPDCWVPRMARALGGH